MPNDFEVGSFSESSPGRKILEIGQTVGKGSGSVSYDGGQYTEGRILAADPQDGGKMHPVLKGSVASGVSNTNVIPVDDVSQYEPDMWVTIPSVGSGANGTFAIQSVDEGASELTLASPPISPSGGDTILVEPSRVVDSVQSSDGSGTTIGVQDASAFEVGQTVNVGTPQYTKVYDVTGSSDGGYAIGIQVIGTFDYQFDARFSASSNTANDIATGLANEISESSTPITASVQNSTEIHIDFSGGFTFYDQAPDVDTVTIDPSGEISIKQSSDDVSIWNEVSSIDEGADEITLVDNLTWTQNSTVLTEPNGPHEVLIRKSGSDGLVARFDTFKESDLYGLTDQAKTFLKDERHLVIT